VASYLQQYGIADERRNRVIRGIAIGVVSLAVITVIAYFVFKDFGEKQKAKRFLQEINSKNFEAAYRDWGCTPQHPCRYYDYGRFMQDWGPAKKATSPWTVASTDSCRYFLTVNVKATGAEPESLAVQRSDGSMTFAPSPECQEPKWRWKQFFHSFFGEPEAPPKPERPSRAVNPVP
jgi:hypothetical protein